MLEQQAILDAARDAVIKAARQGHDEGIRTAAEAVRLSADNFRLIHLLGRDPVAGLHALADALDERLSQEETA